MVLGRAIKLVGGIWRENAWEFYRDEVIGVVGTACSVVLRAAQVDNSVHAYNKWRDRSDRNVRGLVVAGWIGFGLPIPFVIASWFYRAFAGEEKFPSLVRETIIEDRASYACLAVALVAHAVYHRFGRAELGFLRYALAHPLYALFPSLEKYYYTPDGMVRRAAEQELDADGKKLGDIEEKPRSAPMESDNAPFIEKR